jgi:hypothetical protein
VKYLVDEQLNSSVARAINEVAALLDDQFIHILDVAPEGTPDHDIPQLCRTVGANCLVTLNVRDFGSRKVYYKALLAAGIHVVVLRLRSDSAKVHDHLALLADAHPRMRNLIASSDTPILMVGTRSGVRARTLDELIEEFDQGRRLP